MSIFPSSASGNGENIHTMLQWNAYRNVDEYLHAERTVRNLKCYSVLRSP